MSTLLTNKHILLGITSSIAAYKSADIVRRLRDEGAIVRVVMTPHAKQFITPLTLQALSGLPVHDDLFDEQAEAAMGHIALARWADLVLIAPASADFIARLAHGHANDLLTTLCLVTRAPIAIAPAMNQGMWQHVLTQHNVTILKQHGIHFLGPAAGSQACGETGPGRLIETQEIIEKVNQLFNTGEMRDIKVLITAGPTQEAIDPVRFIANHSSGKMGYALATAAKEAGAQTTLITGPTHLSLPTGVTTIPVISTEEMYQAVMKHVANCDIFLAVAAVADYKVETIAKQKIHKTNDSLSLHLIRNPDIVSAVGKLQPKPFIVGFAAETDDVLTSARSKRERKNMDVIVANQVSRGMGMNSDENAVTVISKDREIPIEKMHKELLAKKLITLISQFFNERNHEGKNIGK